MSKSFLKNLASNMNILNSEVPAKEN